MTPDVWSDRIQELGIIITALVGLATAWQGKKLRDVKSDLEGALKRVADLEGIVAHTEGKFRTCVRHVREWMAWERQPEPRGPAPVVPPELINDI